MKLYVGMLSLIIYSNVKVIQQDLNDFGKSRK